MSEIEDRLGTEARKFSEENPVALRYARVSTMVRTARPEAPTEHCPEAQLWTAPNGFATEHEASEFVYAFVRLTKPRHALEVGTYLGHTTLQIARALMDNGRGRLVAFEQDPQAANNARRSIAMFDRAAPVDIFPLSVQSFTNPDNLRFDFAFIDGGNSGECRQDEFETVRPWLAKGAHAIFHDARYYPDLENRLKWLVRRSKLRSFMIFECPRGLALCQT